MTNIWDLLQDVGQTGEMAQTKVEAVAAQEIANINASANNRIAIVQAEAERYGYRLTKDAAYRQAVAQEFTARMNNAGVLGSAKRYAAAQRFTALMQKEGLITATQRSSLATEFAARERAAADKYTALMGKQGQVLSAREYAHAQIMGAKYTSGAAIKSAELTSFAQVQSSQIISKAEIAKAERSAKAVEYSADKQAGATMHAAEQQARATVGAASAQSAGSSVASGFSNFNAMQRMFGARALQERSRKDVVKSYFVFMGLFCLGFFILFIMMDLFGIPILSALADIVAEAGAKAMGFVDAIKEMASSDNIDGIKEMLSDGAAGIGGAIGGMLSAFVAKVGDFFDGIATWFAELGQGMSESLNNLF